MDVVTGDLSPKQNIRPPSSGPLRFSRICRSVQPTDRSGREPPPTLSFAFQFGASASLVVHPKSVPSTVI